MPSRHACLARVEITDGPTNVRESRLTSREAKYTPRPPPPSTRRHYITRSTCRHSSRLRFSCVGREDATAIAQRGAYILQQLKEA